MRRLVWAIIRGVVGWLAMHELGRIARRRRRGERRNPLGWAAPATEECRGSTTAVSLHAEPATRASGLRRGFWRR